MKPRVRQFQVLGVTCWYDEWTGKLSTYLNGRYVTASTISEMESQIQKNQMVCCVF